VVTPSATLSGVLRVGRLTGLLVAREVDDLGACGRCDLFQLGPPQVRHIESQVGLVHCYDPETRLAGAGADAMALTNEYLAHVFLHTAARRRAA
jgi:hypothetical protein